MTGKRLTTESLSHGVDTQETEDTGITGHQTNHSSVSGQLKKASSGYGFHLGQADRNHWKLIPRHGTTDRATSYRKKLGIRVSYADEWKSTLSRFPSKFHAEGTDRVDFSCDLMDQRFGDQFIHPHDRQ